MRWSLHNTSITGKLVLYFLLLNIMTVVVIGSYSYFRAKDALMKRTFDQLASVRTEKQYRIERFFMDRSADLDLMAHTEDVLKMSRMLVNHQTNANHDSLLFLAEYKKFLQKHLLSGNFYTRFFLFAKDGNMVSFLVAPNHELSFSFGTTAPFFGDILRHTQASDRVIFQDYTIAHSSKPAIYGGTGIFDEEGRYLGTIAVEIDANAISNMLLENDPQNGLGQSGESYLVGYDLLMRSHSRFQNDAIYKKVVNTPATQKAKQGVSGHAVIRDYRNIKVLSSFTDLHVNGIDWILITEIDEHEALIPIRSLRNNILYLSALMSLLLFAFVYLIAKRISSPIIRLKQAAEHITDGKYDALVDNIQSNDEINSLISAFNEMSAKIKEQTENLKTERAMRMTSMIDGQELERQRLARELHDGLGQSILAIKMRLERVSKSSPEKAQEILAETKQLIANTISEVRTISNNLIPAILNEFGLSDALKNLCKELTKSSGIEVSLNTSAYQIKSEDKINTYLYRIAQEALNNAMKHSKATEIALRLHSDEAYVYLEINDNGKGFRYHHERKFCGNGINNMRERVQLLQGEIAIESGKGAGTSIQVKIPH